MDQSLKYLNQARTILQGLVDSHPDKIEYKKRLAEIVNRMGYVDFTRRDYPAALRIYQEFQKLCQEILDEVKVGPKPLKIQDHAGKKLLQHCRHVPRSRRCPAVTRGLQKAEENWSKLVGSHPSVTSYQMDLGKAYWSRAWAEYRLGHHADALLSVKHDLDIFNRLSKAEPNNLDYDIEKASALNLKGVIYDDERQNDLARQAFTEAVKLCRSILERSRGIDDRKIELCVSLENLGETYVDGGRCAPGAAPLPGSTRSQAGAECRSPCKSGVCNGCCR